MSVEYDENDRGRVVAITAAAPGWWAVYNKGTADEFRCPVAAWVVTETTVRMHHSGLPSRFPHVYGVDPEGEGWDGSAIENDVEYVFDPSYERLLK